MDGKVLPVAVDISLFQSTKAENYTVQWGSLFHSFFHTPEGKEITEDFRKWVKSGL